MHDIILLTKERTRENRGVVNEKWNEYECIGKLKSATRDEYYKAMSAGIEASIVIEIWEDDYLEAVIVANRKKIYPSRISCDGTVYEIKRSFKKNEKVYLTCEEVT